MSIMSFIITIVSNITVLVPQYIIFFGFFMLMSHGMNKKTPPSASPYLYLPYQVCLLFYKKCLINLLLLWSGYLWKIMHFQRKWEFFFQLIAGQFWFCCFVYMFFMAFFYSSAILKWPIKSCCCFFQFLIKLSLKLRLPP